MTCVYFFFSSRRRHTRYWRDWSSDVCSSDLAPAGKYHAWIAAPSIPGASPTVDFAVESPLGEAALTQMNAEELRRSAAVMRSEERRVGKECRSRMSPDH